MNFLNPYISLIESGLQNLDLPPKPESLYKPQRYILSGSAKRIRPVLVLIGCGMTGGDPKKALPAALAVELLHNFTLIHDDIMDEADSRRGRDAVHVKWDLPVAILAGDSMFVQAYRQLGLLDPAIDFRKMIHIFTEGINHVCEGQALDMEFESRDNVTAQEYLEMIAGKTGALISASLQMGALAGGAADEQLEPLKEAGESLGLAFQVQDDLLDVTADPQKFGKKQGGDICEGKKTILMLTTLERCTTDERERITNAIAEGPLSEEMIQWVSGLFHQYEAIKTAKEMMDTYYAKAEKAIQTFEDSPYKEDLTKLIHFLKNRDY